MASVVQKDVDYPTSDGRPMSETDKHRKNMTDLIETLDGWYADDEMVYVSGNLFVYYKRGDRHKHVSPDLLVSKGVKKHLRDYYLVWEEGKGPDLVIELTSQSTREEDVDDKFAIYRDILRVPEYFLFDPKAEYLKPSLQGYRLHRGQYVPIKKVKGRLPSEILGLHLERDGWELRLYDPATGRWLLTSREQSARDREQSARDRTDRLQAETREQQAELARLQAETQARQAELARLQAEAEAEKLRQELETLRRGAK